MGILITSGKMVGGMNVGGVMYYALFEKMRDDNACLYNPLWSCVAFGKYADVLKRIMIGAIDCASGMIRSSGKRSILPENYVAAWQREMARPYLLADKDITLVVGGYGSSIFTQNAERAFAVLEDSGKHEAVACLKIGGRYSFNLRANVQLVSNLVNQNLLEKWIVFDQYDLTFDRFDFDEKVDPVVGNGVEALQKSVKIFKVDCFAADYEQEFIMRIGDAPYRLYSADCHAFGEYLMEVVYPLELSKRGVFKKLISGFFKKIKAAAPLPKDAVICISRPDPSDEWCSRCYADIQGHVPVGCIDDGLIRISYGELRQMLERVPVLESVPAYDGFGILFFLNYFDETRQTGRYVSWYTNEPVDEDMFAAIFVVNNKDGDMRVLGAINIFEIVTMYGANKGKSLVSALLGQVKALDENISILERQDLPDQVNID